MKAKTLETKRQKKLTSKHEYTTDDLIPQKQQKGKNNQQINVAFNST